MADDTLFKKFIHVRSGKEFDIGFLRESNYIETLGLDGPKLIMSWDDPNRYLKDELQIREQDEIEAHLSDDWAMDGMNVKQKFTVMVDPSADRFLKLNLMASPVFKLKTLSDKTRIFRQRGVAEIIGAVSAGFRIDAGKFPVVEDYHCIAGERPSAMLRQIAGEQGGHLWFGREGWHVKTLAALFAAGPVLSKAHRYAPSLNASQNVRTLGNRPTSSRIAIDFQTHGNGFLTPGMVLKLWWHMATPDRPLDESLPDKVVISSVAHYYSAQKYYCRVKGAVPFEPTA